MVGHPSNAEEQRGTLSDRSTKGVYCSYCGSRDTGQFCSNCGNPLPRLCACGGQVPAEARFCLGCGKAMAATSQARTESPPAPSSPAAIGDIGLVKGDVSISHGISGEHVAHIIEAVRAPVEEPSATQLVARAIESFESGSINDARVLLDQACASDSELAGAHALRARMHSADRDYAAALECWATAFRLSRDCSPFLEHANQTVAELWEDAPLLIAAFEKLPLESLAMRVVASVVRQPRFAPKAVGPLSQFFVGRPSVFALLIKRNRDRAQPMDAMTWSLHFTHKLIGLAAAKERAGELAITQLRQALRYDPDDSECQRVLDQLVGEYAETDAASEEDPLTRRDSRDIDAVPVDEYGACTLHHAARMGDATAVETALSRGIDVDIRDDDGETPLHWAAASSGTEGVVEVLLRHGADVDATSRAYGRTPLHSAAQFGNADAARVLLSAGASVDVRDVGNATPYDVAQSVRNRELTEILGKARG